VMLTLTVKTAAKSKLAAALTPLGKIVVHCTTMITHYKLTAVVISRAHTRS
jgi:hypothetical protein